MAITFLQEQKRQRYLILVFAAIILITMSVLLYGFLLKPQGTKAPEAIAPPKIEINWGVLQDPRLRQLKPFEELRAFQEKIGRDNPFFPYK